MAWTPALTISGDLFGELTRARPTRANDDVIILSAATALAREMNQLDHQWVPASDLEDFAEVLRDEMWTENGFELAKVLERRGWTGIDAEVVEVLDSWGSHLRSAETKAQTAWAAELRIDSHVDGIVRAQRTGRTKGEGWAHPSRHLTAMGQCLFVPDGDFNRFYKSGTFTGGIVVNLEEIVIDREIPFEPPQAA